MTPPVYYYHRVGPFRSGAPLKLNVDPAAFREHMGVIARHAKPVTLDALLEGAASGAAAVTFDDGYRDLLDHALPVLRELRIPATFFIVSGGVGATDSWNEVPGVPNEPLLSWDDLKRILDEGHAIGSHSATHARMDGIDGEALRREAAGSKEELERRLGIRIRHFAYPQGRFSAAAEKAVAEAGYAAGWATRKGRPLTPEDRLAVRRIPVSARIRGRRFRWEMFLRSWGLHA